MISIRTEDGQTFTVARDGVEITVSRPELEELIDDANVLLLVTAEREIVPFEDI